jgi:nitrate reductase NapAB chaperone NapD
VIVISGQRTTDNKNDIEVVEKLMPVIMFRSEAKVIDYEEIERENIIDLLKETHELDSIVKVQLYKMP